ncbi:MAG TPA: histidine kinase [Terriglobia bacterium]|nr:histidine kinase [Terriglobia bacterium]
MTEPNRRGRLKVLLGYVAGVGKTFKMLNEAQDLKRRGVDVVVGYFEPHGRKDTIARAEGLETMPRSELAYRGTTFQEMDTDAILARRPKVCLVDELAHTNVPGSKRVKRWEDVQILLDAGIDVITTLNVQHIESLNDRVRDLSGIIVRETLPDWVVKQADEVVMVDLPPPALLNRLKRGAVYAPEKANQAMENFFKESTLVALRELALRQTAHEVDLRQAAKTAAESRPQAVPDNGNQTQPSPKESTDRLLIHITDHPATAALIRRGRRVADFLRADCFAVFVHKVAELRDLPAREREAVERHLTFARNLRIETRLLRGEDAARAIVDFARLNGITQIFLLRPRRNAWPMNLRRPIHQQVVRLAHDMQVTIVAERRSK